MLATTYASAESLSDPMRPPTTSKSTATVRAVTSAPRVTAIFTSNERRVAVFDGKVVKAGDRIGDVTILEILADGVRYSRNGARGDRSETASLPKQAASVRRVAAPTAAKLEMKP